MVISVSGLRQDTSIIVYRPTKLQEFNNVMVGRICQIMSPDRIVQFEETAIFAPKAFGCGDFDARI